MLFVLTITLWALGKLVLGNIRAAQDFDLAAIDAAAAVALIALALYLVFEAVGGYRKPVVSSQ